MICSCLAADGTRSKSGRLLPGRDPRCAWLLTLADGAQLLGPAGGAAIGWKPAGRGDISLWPLGE